ncbi:RHS repeat-associated core domain-containing protein [Actinocrispum sp. NPDC049592]|uniref:RHS repeat-associated core domain-containing protein n=1 Tax=Actinocrispum sp. NPDC049592 TaxID=3154835 RepID=UPI0034341B47
MRTGTRRLALTLTAVLVTSMVTTTVSPAAWAGEPSVPLPGTPSTSVSEQKVDIPRGDDEAANNELHGNQGPSGGADGGGTSKASPLSPSAKWDVSGQTGDFTWSYPMRVPPVPGGLAPQLALSYASSAVDGRTSATNNQASWIGDGWDMTVGFVERSYIPCANDTMDGTTPPAGVGDLCWRSDNATTSYGGSGGDLILDKDKGWHLRSDDGARVQRIGNPGDANESWKITTLDGTQYFFGSRGDANSTWKVPVFGDDANEPCHQGTFETSQCAMPWRWNLDKVVDRNGNEILYDYTAETNSYGMDNKDAAVPYTRGGTLKSAQYGLNVTRPEPAAAKVDFVTADRCVPGSDCTPDKKDNWPDVPWDDKCDTATCKDQHGPSYWSTKRLSKVVTSVLDGSGYRPVEQWELDQQFPKNGDGEKPALWLKGIKHTGLAGGSAELPSVRFSGIKLPNRVAKLDGIGPLLRYRISQIESEAGGLVTVKYADPDCVTGQAMPAPENNKLRCYPVKWAKKDFAEQTDYFQKYVVAKVTESDRISADQEQVTTYNYLDGAAWAWDDSEFTKDDHRNYNVFHGFRKVEIRKGVTTDPSGPVTKTEERYYQGMNGDHMPSGTRSASVTDSENGTRTDDRWLQGQKFESIVYDGDSAKVMAKTISTPSVQGPTATRGSFQAYMVRPGPETRYTALAAGGWRTTRTEPTYNTHGLVTKTNDLGDTTIATDDKCTSTDYNENTGAWLLSLPSLVKTVAKACTAIPKFPDDAVSAARTFYDGATDSATPPVHGNATRLEDLDQWPDKDHPVTTLKSTTGYDVYGRVKSTKDANGNETKTAYSPEFGGPATQNVVTNAAGQATTSVLETAYGQPVKVTDANNNVTETTYDPLGRKTEIWLPNRSRAQYPHGNVYFSYTYRQDQPTVVTTTSVGPNGNYTTSNDIYDGLLRIRQRQTPAFNGGRLIMDSRYDSQGREFRATMAYFNDAPVDDKIWIASDGDIPGQSAMTYDGLGRMRTQTFKSGVVDKWTYTKDYDGDRVTLTPPSGGTVTTTVYDARGRTAELRQYHGRTAQGDYDSTTYAYAPTDNLAKLVDPAGQVWKYTYDLHGRKIVDDDPDKGVTTMTYDPAGNLATKKDAKGTTLTYGYDALNRRKDERAGTTVLADWTYDSAFGGKGKPATSTRYAGGLAYKSTIEGYDPLGKVLGTTVTVPDSSLNHGIDGSYSSFSDYKDDGSLAHSSFAELPSLLPAEPITYTYDSLGGLETANGGYDGDTFDYVTKTEYTRYGEVARVQLGDPGKRVWLSRYYEPDTRRLSRSIVDAEVASPMQSDTNYTYDATGNVTSIVDKASGQAETQCFRYDYLTRLTEAWTPQSGCTADPTVAALGGVAPYWQSFTYDVSGNRLSQTTHAQAGDTVQTSTYPAAGQPHAHAVNAVATKGPGVNTTGQVTYDANGNVITKPGQILDWDAEGHVAKVTQGSNVTEFVYDADGNRLIRRDPTGTTLYLDGQELRVTKATGARSATRYYKYGNDVVAMRDAKGLTWLAGDHQGSPQIAVNSTNVVQVAHHRQTPFGATRGDATPIAGDKGFVGGVNDPSTGLVHLGAREYDPGLGRFLSVDPLLGKDDPGTMNGYTYSNNNPVSMMDPSGRSFLSFLGTVVSGLAAVASFAAMACAFLCTGPVGWLAGTAFLLTAADFAISAAEGNKANMVIDGIGLITGGLGKVAGASARMAGGAEQIGRAANVMEGVDKGSDVLGVGVGMGGVAGNSIHLNHELDEENQREHENLEKERERQLEAAPPTDMGCYAVGNRSQIISCDSPDAVRPLGASYCKSGLAVPEDCVYTQKEKIDQKKMPGSMNVGNQRTKRDKSTGRPAPKDDYSYGSENSKKSGFYESPDGWIHRNSGGGVPMI